MRNGTTSKGGGNDEPTFEPMELNISCNITKVTGSL